MREIALFLKSYRPDIALVERLLNTVAVYNRDQLGVVISVPAEDHPEFERLAERFTDVSIVTDESFGVPRVTKKIWEMSPGYISQQLVKLSVHRLNLAQNYVMLDSDTYFIRSFGKSDFLTPDGKGFTIIAQDHDLLADPAYAEIGRGRTERIELIGQRLGLPDHARSTCHNNTIFQDVVLRRLHEWREAEGMSLLDLMEIAPVEFTWYTYFLQRYCPERLVTAEPFIKMVHNRSEYRRLLKAGFTHETMRRTYLGICLNSGWAGSDQRRYVARLQRGSWTARLVIRIDRARYVANQELRLFYRARLENSVGRLARLMKGAS